jgi:hypothetical protein
MIVWVERQDLSRAWLRMGVDLEMKDVPLWATGGMYFRIGGTDWELTDQSLRSVMTRHFDGVREDADLFAARIGKEASATPAESNVCGESD